MVGWATHETQMATDEGDEQEEEDAKSKQLMCTGSEAGGNGEHRKERRGRTHARLVMRHGA